MAAGTERRGWPRWAAALERPAFRRPIFRPWRHPRLAFLGEFLRQPWTTGSLWPSSPELARAVVEHCALRTGELVVELGAGTGSFTALLVERLIAPGRVVAVEINAASAAVLRQRFPGCRVVNDAAEHLTRHLARGSVDCIVSGLAWGNMRPRTQDRIFRAILRTLAKHGRLVGFGYVHAWWFPTTRRFLRGLERYFDRVEIKPIVWRNLPPAYVFCCFQPSRARAGGTPRPEGAKG